MDISNKTKTSEEQKKEEKVTHVDMDESNGNTMMRKEKQDRRESGNFFVGFIAGAWGSVGTADVGAVTWKELMNKTPPHRRSKSVADIAMSTEWLRNLEKFDANIGANEERVNVYPTAKNREEGSGTEDSKKRDREDSNPPTPEANKKSKSNKQPEKVSEQMKRLLTKINANVKRLAGIVSDNNNTKREIKETSMVLTKVMREMNS